MLNKLYSSTRQATLNDLSQLIELEKEWPEDTRATEDQLRMRIEKFASGFFVAENQNEIIGSIICHPYHYNPSDLSNFKNWASVATTCYTSDNLLKQSNALYIISGTIKKNYYDPEMFDSGIHGVINLAMQLGKDYVIGGSRIPGYARFLRKNKETTAENYAFMIDRGQFIDPLIEKYRRLGFNVPNINHIIPNYFPDPSSLNYSALVVRYLGA